MGEILQDIGCRYLLEDRFSVHHKLKKNVFGHCKHLLVESYNFQSTMSFEMFTKTNVKIKQLLPDTERKIENVKLKT